MSLDDIVPTDRRLSREAEADLTGRGWSRRSLARIAGLLAAAPALAATVRPASAQGAAKVRIDANECWTGPFEPAVRDAAAAIATGNRYTGSERDAFLKAVAQVETVPADHVMPWPGSSDPLARVIVSFCSPERGLVIADPTFELAGSVAAWLKVKVSKVPLTADHAHDVRAMLAADPNAGVYYVCTPNNPTGTLTSLADIEWLVANKPAGSIVLVDEAYIHFSEAPSAAYLAAQGKDVIVLRTFSKLFGMAGMRMGLTIAKPAFGARLLRYDGMMATYALPNPSLAAATTSLLQADLIKARRAQMQAARASSFALLDERSIPYLPSHANMFMVDWGAPAKEVQKAFAAEGVAIGRSWPVWPNRSRVTVGSMEEMAAFNAAVVKLGLKGA
ncbi:MAG: pyridoxal phosphate-dependent aminotransferase [Phenylobacterium sp.]|uniref:pyridoxal phosphate-dependent aminotransferase n=1 Tax=Phenylobacterium sp. TaxID=1871053 RepID=UPI00391D992C